MHNWSSDAHPLLIIDFYLQEVKLHGFRRISFDVIQRLISTILWYMFIVSPGADSDERWEGFSGQNSDS